MDVNGDNFDSQQQQQNDQQMQCDSSYTSMNTFETTHYGPHMPLELPMQTAIPLPAPPAPLAITKAHQAPTANNSTDIDSLLLQQFSCLGTTDHEELIRQFQSLMNNQMNEDSARFFLEMSNWNLQTAVGCYLDFCNFQIIPSVKILQKGNPYYVQQTWQIQNDGTEAWPKGCYIMSASQSKRFELPIIKPGETCNLIAEFNASHPPIMWRFCTPNGWYFGDAIWMIGPGSCAPEELAERLSQLSTSPSSMTPENFPQINIVISVNMD
ncbi:protein ILRUN [Teleopsis dalmanni]|uniref:protein ILRUN n=1 Tax=Teleopsis dalmanni TaxID=139649 RepID=UPI0018CD080B|nr:protein ILRUN [Teleopsis dalmanni]